MPKTTPEASRPRQRSHRADGIAAAFETSHLDCQAMLVLAALGQARLGALRAASRADGTPADVRPETESTNAARISDITGIPLQTVRRKLEAPTGRGWIERDAEGAYRRVSIGGRSAARRDLSDTDRRAMQRVATLVAELADVVERHETLIGKSRSPAGAQNEQVPAVHRRSGVYRRGEAWQRRRRCSIRRCSGSTGRSRA